MITADFIRKNGSFTGFRISGHAGFQEAPYDIYCAAVSALSLNTVNSIEMFSDVRMTCQMDPEGELMMTLYPPLCDKAELLMKSLHLGLTNISKEYGEQYLKVCVKEV